MTLNHVIIVQMSPQVILKMILNLKEPSLSSVPHEQGRPSMEEQSLWHALWSAPQ